MNKKIILTVILTILISGPIGFFLGNSFQNEDKVCENEVVKPGNKPNGQLTTDTYEIIDNTYYDLVIYNGEVYTDAYMDESEVNSYYGAGSYDKLIETRNKYKEYEFGNLKYSKLDSNIKTMKLDIKNVDKVMEYAYGQSVEPDTLGLVILTKDGSIHIISYYSLINGKTKPKKLEEIKDIKDIELNHNEGGVETDLITRDNKKINLYDYMPKKYSEW